MVLHKSWYTILSVLLGALFVLTSFLILFTPEMMLASLFETFELDESAYDFAHLAMVGNSMRNLVMGGFIIYFAFKNTKTLVLLLIMRFLVELLDLIGGFIWNPDMASQIPIFVVMLGLELFLIIRGRAFLNQSVN